ncbi:hypothetical protein [Tessaracoccus sp.]
MMGDAFELSGHPADLRANTYLSVGTVLDALDQLKPAWDQFTTVRVLDPLSCDPVISVERDERVTRVDVSEVLRGFVSDRTGQPTVHHAGQVREALHQWVNTLPVSDREAGVHGIATITWVDGACVALTLDVVAPRGKSLLRWTPSATLTTAARNQVRAAATTTAITHTQHVNCTTDGTATIWRHQDQRLSSVIFADSDPATRWGTDPNLVCVYTPGFPVVGASPTAALRLAEETMVEHHLMSFSQAAQLTWRGPR